MHIRHVHFGNVLPQPLHVSTAFSESLTVDRLSLRRRFTGSALLRVRPTTRPHRSLPSITNSRQNGVIADWNTFAVDGSTWDSTSSGRIGSSG